MLNLNWKLYDKVEIILNRGYPAETHRVTTKDGYILSIHRIPYGKQSGPSPNKPIVFLLHGLLSSSTDWIITANGLGKVFISHLFSLYDALFFR